MNTQPYITEALRDYYKLMGDRIRKAANENRFIDAYELIEAQSVYTTDLLKCGILDEEDKVGQYKLFS